MTQTTHPAKIRSSQTARSFPTVTSENDVPRAGFWRRVGVASAVALATNVPIFVIANAVMSTPIQAQAADGTIADLPLATVPIASILAVVLGMGLLAVGKRYDKVTPALVIIGVVGALSAFGPAGVDVITNGAMALVPMHFTTTAAIIGTYVWSSR